MRINMEYLTADARSSRRPQRNRAIQDPHIPQGLSPRALRSLRLCVQILLLGVTTLVAQTSYRSTYRVTMDRPAEPAQRTGERSTWRFQVLDQTGSVRTQILREMPFDIAAPAPAVFEDGTVALIHSFDNVVEFYGTDGGLTKRLILSPTPNPEYERVIRHAVHDATLALLISEPASTSCRLVVVDASGSIARERTLAGVQATGVAISPDAGVIAAGVRTGGGPDDEAIWIVNGERVLSVSGGFAKGQFSSDGSSFLGQTNGSVVEVDVRNGEQRWKYPAPTGRLIVAAALGPSGSTILTADTPTLERGNWIYRRPIMRVVASDGQVVSERTVPSMGFTTAKLVPRAGTTQVVFDGVVY